MAKKSAFGTVINMGIAQVESATAVGTITTSGNATVTVTAAGMSGSPLAVSVGVLEDDSPDAWAEKVRTALAANATINAIFDVSGSGPVITLTRKIAAANDATLNIALADDTSAGITEDATSDAVRAGEALSPIAQVSNISGPSLSLDTEDVTTHDSSGGWEEHIATILRSGEVTLDLVFDPNESTHDGSDGLLSRVQDKNVCDFSVVFPGAVTWNFDAFVIGFEPSAPHDGALTASVTLKITGQPTLL